MVASIRRAVRDSLRGVAGAVRGHPVAFGAAMLLTGALSILLPPLVLSLARKPVDYFTFNPWLSRLPEYLWSSDIPLAEKLTRLPDLALFWFSADSPYGGTEWGFAVDVLGLARIALTALLFGAYFALWVEARARRVAGAAALQVGRQGGGALGALVGVVGLSTGPCSVMGCGAPVLPVVALAFVGLSSATLSLFATVSAVAAAGVPAVMGLAVGYLGWLTGRGRES